MCGDLAKIKAQTDCPHAMYEGRRLTRLNQFMEKAIILLGNITPLPEKVLLTANISPKVNAIKSEYNSTLKVLKEIPFDREEFITKVKQLTRKCNDLLSVLEELKLPPVKPRYGELTDAGPGQGVNNFDVQFRDAEMAMLYNSDYRIRIHRSCGDSGQGEAEHTNSAISDAVVDGGTIEWETYKQFEDKTEDDIKQMSLKDYEKYENERMKKNAWEVTRELTHRIEGAPVLKTFIRAFQSEHTDKLFFFNGEYLKMYQHATPGAKETVPGSTYIAKVLLFFKNHYNTGELFMIYLKKDRINKAGVECWYCNSHD